MSAKKSATTDEIPIPAIIADDPKKVAEYTAGWRFGKNTMPEDELRVWFDKLENHDAHITHAAHNGGANGEDSHKENSFIWGYFDACSQDRIHCSDGKSADHCKCERIIDCVDHIHILTRERLTAAPHFCFQARELFGAKVAPHTLRASIVPDEVVHNVLIREAFGDQALADPEGALEELKKS